MPVPVSDFQQRFRYTVQDPGADASPAHVLNRQTVLFCRRHERFVQAALILAATEHPAVGCTAPATAARVGLMERSFSRVAPMHR